jgi:alpha-galactosidase
LRQYAGKGHWNDPDMLEVGNGMTENEDRAHFTMWCMMASPLILGNDVRNMSPVTKAILTNHDIIAIDQDTLGVQGMHVYTEQGLQFWLKPLAGGDWAFTILNPTKLPITYALNWQHFNITDNEVSGRFTDLANTIYKVKNLWTGKMEGKTSKKNRVDRKLVILSHDVITYRLIK